MTTERLKDREGDQLRVDVAGDTLFLDTEGAEIIALARPEVERLKALCEAFLAQPPMHEPEEPL
jgi:hypothetical protein